MKKTFKFFAAALAIVAAASCAKETDAVSVAEEKTPVTLTASFNVDDETKATLVDNKLVHWTDTDKIGVQVFGKWGWDHLDGPFSIDASSNDDNPTFALFNGELSYNSENGYYAVLPATNWSSSSMKFNGFASQTAVKGSFDPNKHLAISERASGSTYTYYKFHNVCALLKVTVGVDNAYSIKVEGKHYDKHGDKYALGDAFAFTESYLSVSGDYKPAYWYSGSGAITLSNNNVALENGATYYIVVPHVTVKEFKVSLCDKAGNVLSEKAKASDFKIERNKVYDLGTFKEVKPDEALEVNPTSLTFDAAAGTQTFTVTSNVEWTVAEYEDWITVTPSGNTVTVAVTENTGAEREATIIVTGDKLKANVTVKQAAGASAPKNYVVYKHAVKVSELVDGGVYIIHRTTSPNTHWYRESDNKLQIKSYKSGPVAGSIVDAHWMVFRKADSTTDPLMGSKEHVVGTLTSLANNLALGSDWYFDEPDGALFTFSQADGYINISFYNVADSYVTYSAYNPNTGNNPTGSAFKWDLDEMMIAE